MLQCRLPANTINFVTVEVGVAVMGSALRKSNKEIPQEVFLTSFSFKNETIPF
jgi:hypothetical protein